MSHSSVRKIVEKMEPWRATVSGQKRETSQTAEITQEEFVQERKYLQKIWEEFAAPLRSDDFSAALGAYQALQKLEERLTCRLKEMKKGLLQI